MVRGFLFGEYRYMAVGGKMSDSEDAERRLYQMENNLEYRVAQLETKNLPDRVQRVEFIAGQLQGEVTAVKEIATSIGVKLDHGIQELKTKQDMQFQELRNDSNKNQSFIKGIVWAAGVVIGLIQLGPVIGEIAKKMIGGS